LKEQLKQALANVEEQERAADASMQPKTLAEVQDLEKKLTDALEEVRSRRTQLEKEGQGGGGAKK